MKLVIVESPTKAKTISKFLGKEYTVLSSYGHVRDLPKSETGVDVENNFSPKYIIPRKSQKNVTALKKEGAKADTIILATDEDREGEAIAWHLVEALGLKDQKLQRIVFHEITKEAIEEALVNPRAINEKLVDAQQARRILDRLVGYELSPFLWKKVVRGLSAGRVQSAALRFVVEREREIQKFKKQEYWTIDAMFSHEGKDFPGKLSAIDEKKLEKLSLGNEAEVKNIVADLNGATYTVASAEKKKKKRTPPPPYTTSTLQQDANMKLGFSAKQTMLFAQQLYENGFITYMRTDSVNLAQRFVMQTTTFVQKTFGENYALPSPRTYTTKTKGAQEAHEAIRPTDPTRTVESVNAILETQQSALYELIWRRAVATQMQEATLEATTIDSTARERYTFRSTGSTIVFDGFLKIAGTETKETILPPLHKGDTLALKTLAPTQHSTEPPPRYSDATLVKTLEEHGIGRPSTYAPTIATLLERNYVARDDRKRLAPQDIAVVVIDLLVEHFPTIVDYAFTAHVEEQLDEIAEGKHAWQNVIREFYTPFHENLKKKEKEVSKKAVTEEATNEVCEKCGKPMVIKTGRFGRFLACTGYPDCRNTKQLTRDESGKEVIEAPQTTDEKCATCGSPMIVKRGRFGPFLSCSRYPECKTMKSFDKKTGVSCPACGKGDIVVKRSKRGRPFYSCNQYPTCTFALWQRPTGEKCPTCGSLLVFKKEGEVQCSNKECPKKG